MPKTNITYRIFVASPSDVQEERNIIRKVVDEINTVHYIKNVNLEIIGWENNTYPAFGVDAQDVINRQIDDDYDIFIGIFWSRLGAPTSRDQSGTKEEFERAYEKFKIDNESTHIFMYFKDSPISISAIDPNQIQLLKDFLEDIRSRGAYTRTFNTIVEFESLVRTQLFQLFSDIQNKVEANLNQPITNNSLIKIEKATPIFEDEELGLYEYLELGVKDIYKVTPELEKITKQITQLGNRMTKKAEKIDVLNHSTRPDKQKELIKLINESANDLDIFNRNVEPPLYLMSESFNNSMENFSKALLIHRDYVNNPTERDDMLNSILGMRTSINYAHDSLQELNTAIKKFPPLTTKLLKSRNQTNKTMANMLNEFNSYLNILDNLIETSFD